MVESVSDPEPRKSHKLTIGAMYSQVGIHREPGHQNQSGSDTEPDSADDPMDIIEIQSVQAAHENADDHHDNDNWNENNIDPLLRVAQPQHENIITPPQHRDENDEADQVAHNLQNDALPSQNLNRPGLVPNHQEQSQGDSQPRRNCTPENNPVSPTLPPLTDLDTNRQGSPAPPLANDNARGSGAHQKRQASLEGTLATAKASKKQKANNGVRTTRSKHKKT